MIVDREFVLVVDSQFFAFRDSGFPLGVHRDVRSGGRYWAERRLAVGRLLSVDLAARWSVVREVAGERHPGPTEIFEALARKGVEIDEHGPVFVSERLRDSADIVEALATASGAPLDVLVLSPMLGLARHRPPPSRSMPRPCSYSWLRWSLASGLVERAWLLLPPWRLAALAPSATDVAGLLDVLVAREGELVLAPSQGIVARSWLDWRGCPEVRKPRAVVIVRTTPAWTDPHFINLVSSAHARDVRLLGPGNALVPRRWESGRVSSEMMSKIAAMPRLLPPPAIPNTIVLEGRRSYLTESSA